MRIGEMTSVFYGHPRGDAYMPTDGRLTLIERLSERLAFVIPVLEPDFSLDQVLLSFTPAAAPPAPAEPAGRWEHLDHRGVMHWCFAVDVAGVHLGTYRATLHKGADPAAVIATALLNVVEE